MTEHTTTEEVFVPQKGRSALLSKRLSECTDEEKVYKRAYARYLKQRYKDRAPEKYARYNSEYGRQYYQMNKDKLLSAARDRRGHPAPAGCPSRRGRKNLSGIVVEFK